MWLLNSLFLLKKDIVVYVGESRLLVIFHDDRHKMSEEYFRHASNSQISYIGGKIKSIKKLKGLEEVIGECVKRGCETILFYNLSDKKVKDASVYISTTQGTCDHDLIEKMMTKKIKVYPNTENLIETEIVSDMVKKFFDFDLNYIVAEGGRESEGTFCQILSFLNNE